MCSGLITLFPGTLEMICLLNFLMLVFEEPDGRNDRFCDMSRVVEKSVVIDGNKAEHILRGSEFGVFWMWNIF